MRNDERQKLVHEIATKLEWDFDELNKLYLALLTDINFHSERKEIEAFFKLKGFIL